MSSIINERKKKGKKKEKKRKEKKRKKAMEEIAFDITKCPCL
jgi:hypothetical protein